MHNERDPRLSAIPDIHGHAKGEHKPYAEERPLPLTARMLFLWFYHACRRGFPRFLMVTDHINYLTFEDPASVNLVRRALKLAQAGDLYGAAETANVDVGHAQVVSEGLRRGMRYSIGAEIDNDPRARPDAQNIVDAMRPDGLVRSVHFIPIDHPIHGANWNWAFDNPEFAALFDHVGTEQTWAGYMAVLLDASERLPGNIVGHFFVPAVFGHWPDDAVLDRYEDQMLDAAAARGMAVEFNTRFLYRDASDEQKQRYIDANRRLLRKAKERGIGIAIGSDAHSPRDQSGAFETVLAVLDELEINEIVFPIAGRLARVALRYVKPAEPEPPPPPVHVPEPPSPVAAAPVAPEPVPATLAKPPRKARAGASSTRPKETSPERAAPRHADEPPFEAPAADPTPAEIPVVEAVAPASEPADAPAPPAPKKATAKPVPIVAKSAPKPASKPAAKPTPKPPAMRSKSSKPPAKAAPKPAAKAAAKPASKPAHKPAAKAKPAAKKAVAKPAPAKRSPAKPAPKSAAKPAPRKAAAKKAAPKKPVRPAKAPAKRPAPKKVARPIAKRAPAKKAAPKKAAAKKPAPKKPAKRR